ncbi:MAG: pyruvate dehydrogenase [Chloroflexi bacterium]|nr:pyruvate dehydrogenase [Chloroflexota bacterium]
MVKAEETAAAQLRAVRERVRDRVLWLSAAIVHWANNVRVNPDGTKVGGHQASSASSAALLTALFFETLEASDRVAIKPHASPVFHAIQYLLGNLPAEYLTQFRAYRGLQAYPSRTKDPDGVDFSTGSVGLGPAAVTFGALTRDYLAKHGLQPASGRFFAHIGDAELDEGSVWETVAEPAVEGLNRCVWIVDLNRHSLDRVVPGIRVSRFRQMFEVNGWTVVIAKYGEELTALMERPGGHALRKRVDDMPNEEYQGIITGPKSEIRSRLLDGAGLLRSELQRCLSDIDDDELGRRIVNLGGHDVGTLARCYQEASNAAGPAVVFAYTVKGWGLPVAGDPRNHAALLNHQQMVELARNLGVSLDEPWQRFEEATAEGRYVKLAADRLRRPATFSEPAFLFSETRIGLPGRTSTQDAFGRMLVELDRSSPESARRIVTVSPDVATSTNLASWINRAGIWSYAETPDFLGFSRRTVKWVQRPVGRHIELGISETNLFLLLGQLGLSSEISGRRLIPIGTLYDPFINRGLDPFVYAMYQGSRFIAVATPSGVTLSHEGGAHQGVLSPSIALEMPGVTYYEPAFGRELEWIMLEAVRCIGAGEGGSYLLRLNTKPVDQSLFPDPAAPADMQALRKTVIDGCYRLRTASADAMETVHIFAVGAMVPEALGALAALEREGIGANVFVVTSPDLLHHRIRRGDRAEMEGEAYTGIDPTGLLSRDEIGRPIVTVIDGHPHALAFLGSALGCHAINLGVDAFGQSGTREDLYRHFRIDSGSIGAAAFAVLDRQRREPRQAPPLMSP